CVGSTTTSSSTNGATRSTATPTTDESDSANPPPAGHSRSASSKLPADSLAQSLRDQVDGVIDVLACRAPVENCDPEDEAVFDHCWGEVDPAAGVDPFHRLPANLIVFEAEGDDRQVRVPDLLDPGHPGQTLVGVLCQIQRAIQSVPEGRHPVQLKREPHRQSPERAAQLGAERGDVPDPHVLVLVAEVRAATQMGVDQGGLFLDQEGADAERE